MSAVDTPIALDSTDDVEGHGLREVAAGLSAVAVVAAGGGIAQAAMQTGPVPHPLAGVSTSDPAGSADRLETNTFATVQHDQDSAITDATTTVASVPSALATDESTVSSTTTRVTTSVAQGADRATAGAASTAAAATASADRTVHGAGPAADVVITAAAASVPVAERTATRIVDSESAVASSAVAGVADATVRTADALLPHL